MDIYLKSLELNGFKSFSSKTCIEFSSGITGIVGPNGCGKSNIVESIKWVLGEQSVKSLRGDKMQDIIFAGTQHRSASGMADVTITFNNDSKWLALEFPEVSIGRRMFRSGESQYFINGIRSRLKDITELFLDTGVGKNSYTIFEQGKIDRLLSESAEERRVLFEDFAGISKFKFRKEEAEKKLHQARENLNKLQETLDRLEKEISSLEVQASDAENYNSLNASLREMEIKFEVARVANMSHEIRCRTDEMNLIKEKLAPISAHLEAHEEQLKISDKALGIKEREFVTINQKNIHLEKELSECSVRYETAKKNHHEINIRKCELEIQSKQDDERLEEWEEILQEKKDYLIDVEKKTKDTKDDLDKIEHISNDLKKEVEILEQDLAKIATDLGIDSKFTKQSVELLRKMVSDLQGQILVQEAEILRLEEETTTNNCILQEIKDTLSHLNSAELTIRSSQKKINTEREILFETLQNMEQLISNLEIEHKNMTSSSNILDQKIIQSLDHHITELKLFSKDHKSQQQDFSALLSKIENAINFNQILAKSILDELRLTIHNQDLIHQQLLESIFGKDGIFTEKIEISKQLEITSVQLSSHRDELRILRVNFDQINNQESKLSQKLRDLEGLVKNSNKEYEKTKNFLTTLSEKLIEIKTNHKNTSNEMLIHQNKLLKLENSILNYEQNSSELQEKNYKLQEQLMDARINHNTYETNARSLETEIKSLKERLIDLHTERKKDVINLTQYQKTLALLKEEMEDLCLEQDEIKPELEKIQEELRQHFIDIADLRQAKKNLEKKHKDDMEQYTKLRMHESEIEGSLSERIKTLSYMKNALQEQFPAHETSIILEPEDTTENLNQKIRLYRSRLNEMGNVNLLAIEQLHGSKEHYTKLSHQKQDIESATADTIMLINETDKESAERFRNAFDQIRNAFCKLFSELFNGGKADLILKDPLHPLQSGIDIMAEPPGQKFQNISLLSGGQRAMIAISVIFSMLELKPTPFVILDEMDAPLDDENIDRFKNLLARFKGISQFVVVSHSKSTLEVCDMLFGITMEELGCSKVLSVAFDETENLLFT